MTGIIDYGAGNIFSLTAALERLGLEYAMVDKDTDPARFNRYIIPGVGHAGAAMEQLTASGMAQIIPAIRKPVLGICVGMQLMTRHSQEGDSKLLGLFSLDTLHFPRKSGYKVPHMGWNRVTIEKNSALFAGMEKDPYFYFVHSYYIPYQAGLTSAYATYDLRFSAAFEQANFYGVQFHPEKSGATGELLLSNFCSMN